MNVNSKTPILVCILIYFFTLKILYLYYAPPLPDEAYYWLWAQRIDFSFYDHPPLSMWVQSLFSIVSSNKYFLIRVVPTLSFLFVMCLGFYWMKRVGLLTHINDYLKFLLLLFSIPVINVFLTISFPDPMLICMLLTSGFFLHLYLESEKSSNPNQYFLWYISVGFFGLALISKYNAILFGIGVLLFLFLSKKKQNNILYTKHFGFSLLLILTISYPVIFWNIKNDYASLGFNLNKRLDFKLDWIDFLRNAIVFFFSVIVSFSPILVLNIMRLNKSMTDNEGPFPTLKLAKFVFFASLIFCLLLSFFAQSLYYWIIPGFVLFIPYLTVILRNRTHQVLTYSYGLIVTTVLSFNTMSYPIALLTQEQVDRETAILHGWEKIIEVLNEQKEKNNIEKILFSDYRLASLYSFHSGITFIDVLMEKRETQFDIWRPDNINLPSSLILVDKDFPINYKIKSMFVKTRFLKDIDVKLRDKTVRVYQLYIGIND